MAIPRRPTADLAVRAALIGCAAGARATFGVGLPALASRPAGRPLPLRLGALALMGGEMVWDQLPNCPSRLEWPGLAGRMASGAVGAAVIARAKRQPVAGAAAVAVVTAVATAVVANRWRQRWSERHPAWLGGALEDVAAVAAASLASR